MRQHYCPWQLQQYIEGISFWQNTVLLCSLEKKMQYRRDGKNAKRKNDTRTIFLHLSLQGKMSYSVFECIVAAACAWPLNIHVPWNAILKLVMTGMRQSLADNRLLPVTTEKTGFCFLLR